MTQHRTQPAGFTLIELMVSIAIALLLILGVNQVFKISSETAGQGQALSTINRDNRAIQNTLVLDFKNLVPVPGGASQTTDGPLFIINSQTMGAFRNARDKSAASDPADPRHEPTLFASSTPSGHWNPALLNFRNHRIDRVAFFARGLYARQTASPNAGFVAPGTASEAYIWYGHGMLPNPGNVYFGPGDPDPANTTNQVASDFFLCRQAILLTPTITDSNYLQPASQSNAVLAPLGYGSPSNDNASPGGMAYQVQDSRYDIGISSIQQFGLLLSQYAGSNPNNWWYPLLFNIADPKLPPYRFKVDPFLTRPSGYTGAKVTPDAMAKASPCLVRGCSQFIVEFAGNFYTKSDNGSMAHPLPDPNGQLDYYADYDSTGKFIVAKHIRWYGFPRDTNGDGIIDYRDVMPLRAMLGQSIGIDNKTLVDDVEPPTNVASVQSPYSGGVPTSGFDYKQSVLPTSTYTAAWGPTTTLPFPKMIRVTIAIDDPNGRLGDEQFFEYIFDVQP
jgi:prepilin-type N-terminal cleavage/methylation domain-containing protein